MATHSARIFLAFSLVIVGRKNLGSSATRARICSKIVLAFCSAIAHRFTTSDQHNKRLVALELKQHLHEQTTWLVDQRQRDRLTVDPFSAALERFCKLAEKLSHCDGILLRPEMLSLLAGHGWTLQKTPDHRPGVRWSSRAREIAGAQRGTTAAGALLSI